MGSLPGTRPTGPALKAASVAGGPAVSAAAKTAQARRKADPRASSPGSTAARQRAGIEKIKADRAPEPAVTPAAPTVPPPASPGGGPSLPAVPAAAATGSGFLLGVGVWAVALAYLKGGWPAVRQFGAAKFLNKTP